MNSDTNDVHLDEFNICHLEDDNCMVATISDSDGEVCVLRPEELYNLVTGQRVMLYFPSYACGACLSDIFTTDVPYEILQEFPRIMKLNWRFIREAPRIVQLNKRFA